MGKKIDGLLRLVEDISKPPCYLTIIMTEENAARQHQEYVDSVNKMFPEPMTGSLVYYYKTFLLEHSRDEDRQKSMEEHAALVAKEEEILQKKIANTRKAMGVRKNDPNSQEVCKLIEDWQFKSLRRICKR